MENFLKKLKGKLSMENVVELVEDGKVIDEDEFKENINEAADEINTNSYLISKVNSIKKLQQPDENKIENDLKDSDSASSNLNVENANEAQEEHSKPHNRDLTFFF
ncbi:unnamed protein product, partial [Brenthis ino]